MGTYLNPGNSGFKRILKANYVDKTAMIGLVNDRIESSNNLICVSRPRRFGKSYAAQMLCAYYDHTCDSHSLFDDKEVSKTKGYKDNLNKYNVIYLDIAGFVSDAMRRDGSIKQIVNRIVDSVHQELINDHPELKDIESVSDCIIAYAETTKMKFIFIIDEWDAIIREAENDTEIQKAYLNLLREWFKNGNFTSKAVVAAYMTGILPIKKDKGQSAVSDFKEFTATKPYMFAKYFGFTEDEVKKICSDYDMDFDEAKKWYDGYSFDKASSIYNPYSVMMAMQMGEYESYWKQTSVAENLVTYINMNFQNLQSDILKLIAGEHLKVNVTNFQNDFQNFRSKDDVLTLLIHLGYLAYDSREKRVRIPNEEVRLEFDGLLQNAEHTKLANLIINSEKLLQDTLNGNEKAVMEAIVHIRNTNYAPMFYNNEQALRYVIKFAYIVCIDYYLKVEELPTGHGIADVVFLPKRDTSLPAMIVELKWNRTADGAIRQMKEKDYPSLISEYTGDILLVGINYDEDTKEHSCRIEKIKISCNTKK